MRLLLALLALALVGCPEPPCPELLALEAADGGNVVFNSVATELALSGSGFETLEGEDGSTLVPAALLTRGDERVEAGVTWGDEENLTLTVPATEPPMTPGLWDLTVTNPSGCEATLAEAVEVRWPPRDEAIALVELIPPFGWTEEPTAVAILGAGFVSTPRAWLSTGGETRDWELDQVAFIDGGSLSAVVPAGVPAGGPYDLVLVNPDAGWNVLEAAFTVTAEAPPDIASVTPEAGQTQEDTPVVIEGEHFDAGAQVLLLGADGTEVAARVDAAAEDRIDASFPTSGALTAGAWLVRVVNEDGTWDDYAAFVVRNPSAKLGTAGSWATGPSMGGARTGLGLVAHTDGLGRGSLYAVGGQDGERVLDTVERARADVFGALAAWEAMPTRLTTPRAHGAVLELDGWVYAFGGEDENGPVDTVERARVLVDEAGARPTITGAEPAEGSLDAGAWYYRVSAVMPEADPDNPLGETPASGFHVARLREAGGVTLHWTAVPGAASYRVYRSDAANGAAGAEHRIAEDLAGSSFTDDGLPAGTEPFVPEGALGAWQELPERLPSAWAHGAAVQAVDPAGERFVYLVGGTDGQGPLGAVYAMGEDGAWFTAGTLAIPRVDNMAAVAGPEQAANLGEDSPVYLLAMEGDDGAGATNDVVFAPLTEGGSLGAWSSLNRVNAGGQARIDGVGLAAAGHLYILGGAGSPTDAESSGRQSEIQGPGMDVGAWSSTSTSGTLRVRRADFAVVRLRAVLYAAGGRIETGAVTPTVEQVVF